MYIEHHRFCSSLLGFFSHLTRRIAFSMLFPVDVFYIGRVYSFHDYETALSVACHADMISFTGNIKIMLFMHFECTCTLHRHSFFVRYTLPHSIHRFLPQFCGVFFLDCVQCTSECVVSDFFFVSISIPFRETLSSSIITKLICSLLPATKWKISVFLTCQHKNKLLIEVSMCTRQSVFCLCVCVCVILLLPWRKIKLIFFCYNIV